MDWPSEVNELGLVCLAGFLGSLIGLEREFAAKPAGLRTHFFVAAASAVLTLIGERLVSSFVTANPDQVINTDPLRVIHAIVIGISFLGTGTIMHERQAHGAGIEGLTTAASILLTAAVGIAVAIESYVLAIGVSVITVAVLLLFSRINRRIEAYRERHRPQ